MQRRRLFTDILLHAALILTVYVFQALVFPHITALRLAPLLLPLATVGTAVFEGRMRGGIFGVFAGIFCDVAFTQPVASMTVLLMLAGLIIGFLSETIIARGFPAYFVCGLLVLVVSSFVQMFSLLFFQGIPATVLLPTAGYEILFSMIFSVPLYFVSRRLGHFSRPA